jgi:hypothetical protein
LRSGIGHHFIEHPCFRSCLKAFSKNRSAKLYGFPLFQNFCEEFHLLHGGKFFT